MQNHLIHIPKNKIIPVCKRLIKQGHSQSIDGSDLIPRIQYAERMFSGKDVRMIVSEKEMRAISSILKYLNEYKG